MENEGIQRKLEPILIGWSRPEVFQGIKWSSNWTYYSTIIVFENTRAAREILDKVSALKRKERKKDREVIQLYQYNSVF